MGSESIHKLNRLLRVRTLQESAAKLVLDADQAMYRECMSHLQSAHHSAARALDGRNVALAQALPGTGWRERDAESALFQQVAEAEAHRLKKLGVRVEASRDAYLECRKQKQQVEALHRQATLQRVKEQQRRDAAALDDLLRMRQSLSR
jgi:flagellar biosynthesis chaperone FliJ